MAKTPGLNLPFGIDPVNAVPVDSKYGPYANTAAAIAAIPLASRFDGLTVMITGTGEYWWNQADLTDTGLKVKGGAGGATNAIVRYIYLVADSTDQTRMGGTAANVYITAQAAYDAANTLQTTLGGSNKVVILVGNTTAAVVGDITLSANWNTFVLLQGINSKVSAIGSIIATNASGSAYSVGTGTNTLQFFAQGLTISAIDLTATGTSGSGGNLYLTGRDIDIIGTINVSCTNASNTTGSTGSIFINTVANITTNTLIFGTNIYIFLIQNTLQTGSSGSSGSIGVEGSDVYIKRINYTGAKGSHLIVANGFNGVVTIGQINYTGVSATGQLILNNVIGSTGYNIDTFNSIQLNNFNMFGFGLTLSSLAGTVDINNSTMSGIGAGGATVIARHSIFHSGGVGAIGNNSKFKGCTFNGDNSSPPVNGLGTGCKFYNCSMSANSGSAVAIDNASPVSVVVENCTLENGYGTNITLITEDNPQTLTDAATVTWNYSLGYNATVTLGGNRTLAITKVNPGNYGTIKIVQDIVGSRTLTLPAGSKVANNGVGALTLSTGANAIDIAVFYFDGTTYFWNLLPSLT